MPSQPPRTAFAPNFGRQPEQPPVAPPPPSQPGWSGQTQDKSPWKNEWQSHGQGVWDQTTPARDWRESPWIKPADIDQSRLQPRDIGDLGVANPRPQIRPLFAAETEPMDDAVPTGSSAPQLSGGQEPAGSPPPPADEQGGIGTQQSGLGVQQSGMDGGGDDYLRGLQEYSNRPENRGRDQAELDREYRALLDEQRRRAEEQNRDPDYDNRGEAYKNVDDDELDRRIAEAREVMRGPSAHAKDAERELAVLMNEKFQRNARRNSRNSVPDSAYIRGVSEATGLSEEQVRNDYAQGYRWALDPASGEWTRYSFDDMLETMSAFMGPAYGYQRGDNAYMDRILDALEAGQMPRMSDLDMARVAFDSDRDLQIWHHGFRGQTKTELEQSNAYADSGEIGGKGDGGRDWESEFNDLFQGVLDEMGKPFDPFDESGMKQASALDRSQQMRAALEAGSSQGAATGQIQSAMTDIGLRSEAELNQQVADRKMTEQIAQHQRNLSLIQQASAMLLTKMGQAASAEERAANRNLQMALAQMSASQQNRMMQIEQERARQQTFWGSLGGIFGGLLGLGGQLGGGYLSRPG